MSRLFGTDGIRGIVGIELSPDLAFRVGVALTETIQNSGKYRPKILIGMDTRESSPALSASLADGVKSVGGVAIDIGVCSTPAVAYLSKKHSFDAGVMISASHNPYEYNGIKIFGSEGYKISDDIEKEIEARIFRNEEITPITAKEEYINYLKSTFGISLDGLRIGIDCANGSASATAEELFTSLGAECYMIADTPDGKNINNRCGSTCLDGLRALVLSHRLDVGIAFDGDADRCIAIDECGHEVDGDYIMAILTLVLKEDGRLYENTLVGTVMTNLGLKKFCEQNGIKFKSTPVGDRFVFEALKNGGYSLGGEQSGHIILPDFATTGDGQLTAIALLSQIKKIGKSLSTLAEIMKKYPQITKNIVADSLDKLAVTTDEAIKKIIYSQEKELDGRGRIVVRPSGTEALIRISTEADTEEKAELICSALVEKISSRLLELKSYVG